MEPHRSVRKMGSLSLTLNSLTRLDQCEEIKLPAPGVFSLARLDETRRSPSDVDQVESDYLHKIYRTYRREKLKGFTCCRKIWKLVFMNFIQGDRKITKAIVEIGMLTQWNGLEKL